MEHNPTAVPQSPLSSGHGAQMLATPPREPAVTFQTPGTSVHQDKTPEAPWPSFSAPARQLEPIYRYSHFEAPGNKPPPQNIPTHVSAPLTPLAPLPTATNPVWRKGVKVKIVHTNESLDATYVTNFKRGTYRYSTRTAAAVPQVMVTVPTSKGSMEQIWRCAKSRYCNFCRETAPAPPVPVPAGSSGSERLTASFQPLPGHSLQQQPDVAGMPHVVAPARHDHMASSTRGAGSGQRWSELPAASEQLTPNKLQFSIDLNAVSPEQRTFVLALHRYHADMKENVGPQHPHPYSDEAAPAQYASGGGVPKQDEEGSDLFDFIDIDTEDGAMWDLGGPDA